MSKYIYVKLKIEYQETILKKLKLKLKNRFLHYKLRNRFSFYLYPTLAFQEPTIHGKRCDFHLKKRFWIIAFEFFRKSNPLKI